MAPEPSFHLFGKLPTELRRMIWRFALEPRIVTILPSWDCYEMQPRRKPRLPASGYVNRESRSETLRHYKRCFELEGDFHWFNFDLDTLCSPTGVCLQICQFRDPSDLMKVQRMISPNSLPNKLKAKMPCEDTWPDPVIDSIDPSDEVQEGLESNFPALREVTLTSFRWHLHHEIEEYTGDVIGVSWQRDDSHCYAKLAHMRTAYLGKVRVNYSPRGEKSHQQRYCCRLREKDAIWLDRVIGLL
ncbi:hypothetical protein F4808DRAFT_32234 [Astrocystis sublimbata]|nr:hypothetical protein F4808DRAFT_32234 [Astrocystis sublimbata]